VESAPGKGATFRVYLPAHGVEESGASPPAPALPPRAQGETILVVEDEAGLALICSKLLVSHGYRVLIANDGVEAVRLYASQSAEIAAVLTDLMMPVMNGIAALHAMRRINPALKALAATGLPTPDQIQAATAAGASDLLAKPYNPIALLCALHTLLHG
jgi:CheY-like chemotaxis protein